MHLPVMPPLKPMLATSVPVIPPGMHYEPKWDGFRCLVFKDGDEVVLGSRNEKPLTRYFPEIVAAAQAELPDRCVLDGEVVVVTESGLDFDVLQNRLHPAESRVTKLAVETPASFIAFDLLAVADTSYLARPFAERRTALETALASAQAPIFLTPATRDAELAQRWFSVFEGAGLDGIVAKPLDLPYAPDQRLMRKIKHARTADCVIGGFRWHASGKVVGSLLLGLFDDAGRLQHVGVCAAFTAARRKQLVSELEPYLMPSPAGHPWAAWSEGIVADGTGDRVPGERSRWSAGKDLSWLPLRPELVVEVGYDHLQGGRFRHTAQFKRWRPDRDAASCTYAQLERPVAFTLADVLGSTG